MATHPLGPSYFPDRCQSNVDRECRGRVIDFIPHKLGGTQELLNPIVWEVTQLSKTCFKQHINPVAWGTMTEIEDGKMLGFCSVIDYYVVHQRWTRGSERAILGSCPYVVTRIATKGTGEASFRVRQFVPRALS